ncbi:MAG: hypothetical protein ACRDUW_00845 [Pseudonocardiaceae bacterium]
MAVEDQAEPARATKQFDLPSDPGTQSLVLDLADCLVEDVAVVTHHLCPVHPADQRHPAVVTLGDHD